MATRGARAKVGKDRQGNLRESSTLQPSPRLPDSAFVADISAAVTLLSARSDIGLQGMFFSIFLSGGGLPNGLADLESEHRLGFFFWRGCGLLCSSNIEVMG